MKNPLPQSKIKEQDTLQRIPVCSSMFRITSGRKTIEQLRQDHMLSTIFRIILGRKTCAKRLLKSSLFARFCSRSSEDATRQSRLNPTHSLTQDKWNKAFAEDPHVLPDYLNTPDMCNRAVDANTYALGDVPQHFMCNKTVDSNWNMLQYVPDRFLHRKYEITGGLSSVLIDSLYHSWPLLS